jgi:hypothetical protein
MHWQCTVDGLILRSVVRWIFLLVYGGGVRWRTAAANAASLWCCYWCCLSCSLLCLRCRCRTAVYWWFTDAAAQVLLHNVMQCYAVAAHYCACGWCRTAVNGGHYRNSAATALQCCLMLCNHAVTVLLLCLRLPDAVRLASYFLMWSCTVVYCCTISAQCCAMLCNAVRSAVALLMPTVTDTMHGCKVDDTVSYYSDCAVVITGGGVRCTMLLMLSMLYTVLLQRYCACCWCHAWGVQWCTVSYYSRLLPPLYCCNTAQCCAMLLQCYFQCWRPLLCLRSTMLHAAAVCTRMFYGLDGRTMVYYCWKCYCS